MDSAEDEGWTSSRV